MKKSNKSNGKPTLTELQRQFGQWRKKKRHAGERIPESLWSAAIDLTEDHSIFEVSKSLKLSHADLKNRVALASLEKTVCQDSLPGFVELPHRAGQSSVPGFKVELEDATGRKMRISLEGSHGVDIHHLIIGFWSCKI